jgi:L-lactate dehydrogenase complex protein LldG
MMDTSQARAAILARIRANSRRAPQPTAVERAAVDEYLAQHPPGPRPRIEGELKIRFRAMAERSQSTVGEVARTADAPAAVARYLATQRLEPRAVIWPALAPLDWKGAGIEVEARAPRRDESHGSDRIGITGCFCALAETGTLVLLSGPDTHASTHLLPETHVALVPAARIVRDMEDAFALLRAERGQLPRSVNMVSGPSRTGDIEQTIVLGAHGPFRVHIVVLTEE